MKTLPEKTLRSEVHFQQSLNNNLQKQQLLHTPAMSIPRENSRMGSHLKYLPKYLGLSLTKIVKNFYNRNFRTQKKDIKKDRRRRKDLPHREVVRINIVKVVRSPKGSQSIMGGGRQSIIGVSLS